MHLDSFGGSEGVDVGDCISRIASLPLGFVCCPPDYAEGGLATTEAGAKFNLDKVVCLRRCHFEPDVGIDAGAHVVRNLPVRVIAVAGVVDLNPSRLFKSERYPQPEQELPPPVNLFEGDLNVLDAQHLAELFHNNHRELFPSREANFLRNFILLAVSETNHDVCQRLFLYCVRRGVDVIGAL